MTEDKKFVGILIFDDVELLDFAGPFEVFSSVHEPNDSQLLMNVFTIAENEKLVRCRNGMDVKPKYAFSNCPKLDIMLVPGGQGTRREVHNPRIIHWIKQRIPGTELITSVCTGSFLLAEAGLLDGKKATTHWGSINRMQQDYPDVEVQSDVRWVDEGTVVTSAGVSAGIDMALHVVEKLYGPELAASTARNLEYDYWQPEK